MDTQLRGKERKENFNLDKNAKYLYNVFLKSRNKDKVRDNIKYWPSYLIL